MFRAHYESHNPWQAAYLLTMNVPLVKVYKAPNGKVNYLFDNADDRAWQTSLTWAQNGDCTVDAVAYMKAYKQMAQARDEARSTGAYQDGNDSRAAY